MAERSPCVVVLRAVAREVESALAAVGQDPAQLPSTGEEFLSVSPWRYDRRESMNEHRRLRDEARSTAGANQRRVLQV